MSEEPLDGQNFTPLKGICLKRNPQEQNQHAERMLQRGHAKDRKRGRLSTKKPGK